MMQTNNCIMETESIHPVNRNYNCTMKTGTDTYNHGHNILELYNVLIETQLTTCKTKCYI